MSFIDKLYELDEYVLEDFIMRRSTNRGYDDYKSETDLTVQLMNLGKQIGMEPAEGTTYFYAKTKEGYRLKEQINRMYKDQKHIGHRYVFSNIPNDDNGQSLVKTMRFYLNKDTYNMRVRGQYLDKSKLERGESWKTYDDGQPLSKSKCIRLYIDKKKESA